MLRAFLPPFLVVQRILLVVFLSLIALPGARSAAPVDAVAELGAFSVFPNVDPTQLLKGDVKTARGPAMDSARALSVQSCYVVAGPPAKSIEALQAWDASRHPELKIILHSDLPASPGPANFSRLDAAPNNGPVRALVDATAKLGLELQISLEEAKKFTPAPGAPSKGALPENVRSFWATVLSGRAQEFVAGGAMRQPAYDHTGQAIRPGEEFAGLLRQQEKIRRQFAGFLGESGVIGGRGSLKKDLYFELINVDDDGVLTLGSFSSKPVGSGYQAADVSYYASGGYYVALTLYQMWPVDVGGQPATLVWRGDLISAASLASLHGMEKLASESAMMKDVSKAVNFLKRDTAGGR